MFVYKYKQFTEDFYQQVSSCGTCNTYVRDYRKYIFCSRHDENKSFIWPIPLIIAVLWPMVFVGFVIVVAVSKSFFPKGVHTPTKDAREIKIKSMQIEDRQRKLDKEMEKLRQLERGN